MSSVRIGGSEYGFAPLRISVLRGNWARVVSLVGALVTLFRMVAGLAKQCIREDGSGLDKSRLLGELSGDAFGGAVKRSLESLSHDQVEAMEDLIWASVSRRCPSLSREAWDDLLTLDVFPDVVMAFLQAQGLQFGAQKGEAQPG